MDMQNAINIRCRFSCHRYHMYGSCMNTVTIMSHGMACVDVVTDNTHAIYWNSQMLTCMDTTTGVICDVTYA
jgi:hypothetical protein